MSNVTIGSVKSLEQASQILHANMTVNPSPTTSVGTEYQIQQVPAATDWDAYLTANPDVLAEYNHLSPNNLKNNLGITDADQFAEWHYQNYGKADGRAVTTIAGSNTTGSGMSLADYGRSLANAVRNVFGG